MGENPARRYLPYALIAAAVAAVYWPAPGFDFVSYDDGVYVFGNPHVRSGPTWGGLAWAFGTFQRSNWHPLTWLSLMIDAGIGGVRPQVYHFTNVVLHLANSILLFVVLAWMTRKEWRSALVALLFAVHPLHVESVAWISERKDTLSTLLGLLAILAWLGWTERRSPGRRALVVLLLALGLMAKPMLVTLPVVLLILDWWPLGRARTGAARPVATGRPGWGSLLWEKAPLALLAAASCVITLVAQRSGGAIAPLEDYGFGARVANAVVSYVRYIGRTLWPADLAVFYPIPREGWPAWTVAGCAILLGAITALTIAVRRRRPYLLAGWLWYLITLVPVIGIVQVGDQAMADRYTYVPLTGLFIMVVWGGADLFMSVGRRAEFLEEDGGHAGSRGGSNGGVKEDGAARGNEMGAQYPKGVTPEDPQRRPAGLGPHGLGAIAAGAVVVALAACAHAQVWHWRDSVALYEHALAVTRENAVAHNNLGLALLDRDRLQEAAAHLREALRIDPRYSEIRSNLALALIRDRRYDEAIAESSEALKRWPDDDLAHARLGLALALSGRRDAAEPHLREALRLNAENIEARINLGALLADTGRGDEARLQAAAALRIDPWNADARRLADRLQRRR
jgi:Tfp pilus assembly protein PilF